jgi:hypothetical protein
MSNTEIIHLKNNKEERTKIHRESSGMNPINNPTAL